MRRLAAAVVLLAVAAPAAAAPVIEQVDQRLTRGRRLTVTVEALLDGPGEVRVEGTVNGKKFRKRRRARKAGARRLRVRIDTRRLRIRRLDTALVFDLRAVVEEKDGARAERPVTRTVPVPVIFLPGLGNELPAAGPASSAFAAAVNLAAGGVYDLNGDDATFVVHHYDSLSESLTTAARGVRKRARRLLRGKPFRCVDVVGYSMGGLVARRWMADDRRARVRNVVFLGTPNQGAPLAQLLGIALDTDLLDAAAGGSLPDLGPFGDLGDVVGALGGTEQAVDVLRRLYPTYPWLFVTIDIPILGGRLPVTPELIERFGAFVPVLGSLPLDMTSPLTPLASVPPAARTAYYAIGYSSVPGQDGPVPGTVDEVDATGLLSGDGIDPAALATGDGDGLVPWRSLVFADTPLWNGAVEATDLGAGTHVTLLADPRVIARVAALLAD